MSELKVNKVSPRSGTNLTIGDSGDTTNIVGTLQNNGAALVGDISSVVAGTGLSGGGTSGAVTVNIEAAQPTVTSTGTLTSATISGDLTVDTNTLFVDASENSVCIGTTTAQAKLHIVKNDAGALNDSNSNMFMIENTTATGMAIGSSNSGEGHIYFSDSDDADVGTISYFHSDNSLRFRVNASEPMRIHSNGVLSASAGIALGVGTASTASNVLNDYEEGTWTPVMAASGTNPSVGYAVQEGRYTKIGRQVIAPFRIQLNALTLGSASGNIQIQGLPFTSASTSSSNFPGSVYYVSNVNFNLSSFGTITVGIATNPNSAAGGLARTKNSGGADGLPIATLASNTDVSAVFIYEV